MKYPGEWRDTGQGYATRKVKSGSKTPKATGRITGQAGKAARAVTARSDKIKKKY